MPIKTNKKAAAAASRTPEAESALKELLIDEIKDIYWAEKHLATTLPKLIKGATSEANDHYAPGRNQKSRYPPGKCI